MDGFIGEIRLFAAQNVPAGWELCAGQLLQIQDHTALFSIIGTTYGGDGKTTFQLPDLRGRAALGAGQSHGTSYYPIGAKMGSETVALTVENLPEHTHQQMASANGPTKNSAVDSVLASNTNMNNPNMPNIYTDPANLVDMGAASSATGQGQPFSVMQPSLVLNYLICLLGTYPRSDNQ